MTTEDATRIGAYVRKLADRLELKDWRIGIADEPCDDDCTAQIAITYGQRYATISLAADWASYPPGKQRQTLAHELLHCHLHPAGEVIDSLSSVLGSPAYQVASSGHRLAVEYATEAIAHAVAPHLPLPTVAKEDATDA